MEPVRPTLLDRALAAVAPGRAARRLAARASYTAIAASVTDPEGRIERTSGYRAGRSDRRQTKGWFARPKSANSDGIGRQQTLIGRSRDAAMNLPPATAAIERNVTFAIGTGLMAIPDLDGETLGLTPKEVAAWTARIKRDYDEYMSSTDPDAERTATGYGLQEVVLRGQLESGDLLGLRCWPSDQIGRVTMTAWKLVEAERVVSPFGHVDGKRWGGENGPVVVGGVEQDSYGAAQAYHVLTKPRGPGNSGRRANDTTRYEAWGKETQLPTAVLVFDKRRPEQARGVPLLAPVLELVKVFADATDAAALSLVLQSMLAVVYSSPGATAMPEPEYGDGELVQAEGVPETLSGGTSSDIKMEPGMVVEIDSDAKVDLKSPGKDNPVYEKFFEAVLTQIGAAIGTPFGVLMARFNSSYTASKGEMELFYKEVLRRVGRFTASWCKPGYDCWMYEQVARGVYDLPGFLDDLRVRAAWCSVRWAGDGKISLDPLREAKALEVHEAHAWQTGQQIAAAINGGDYDANVQRRGAEHRQFVDEGLPIPNAQGGGSDTGGTQASADGTSNGGSSQ
ncbi:phage portal protein [Novosphingobium mangrovi (ex Huang et al. 2023)]|uniref:Phage portal protein n=1 Tax=Novosphingobium mangrovi (ex Huang et al. 2023) TaxID=2976432 RepID=A0ABT2I137_9SPHN|nr:phage portal protein [Novosphingobium mangrovi (ex Huang et al. 2023)]MCT2398519.1 phage portal protein [Novosphingobium mangrovi (ex Huang et al. 2023)]